MFLRASVVLAATLLHSTPLLRAQTPAPAPMPNPAPAPSAALTLEECVAQALAKNFDLRVQRFATENARDALEIAKSRFDPTISSTTRRTTSQEYSQSAGLNDDGVIVILPRQKSDGFNTGISVEQDFATGTSLAVDTGVNRSHQNPSSRRPNPAFTGDASVSLRQQILRGFGTAYNRAPIERARIGITRAQYDLRGAVLTVIRSVESAYYNLAFSREQLNVRRFSLDLAQRLLDENREKKNTGVATDLDVLQAEVGVANARRALLLAEQTVRDRQDLLLSLINPFQFDMGVGAISLGEDPILTVSFDHSYKLARENDPDYASLRANLEQLKLDELVARRNKLPALSVGATAAYDAREASARQAYSNVFNRDGYEYIFDLSVSVPWGMRAEKARHRQAKSALQQAQARLEQLDQAIVVDVRSAVRAVETNMESVKISGLATQLSQRQYDLEKARYDAGLSTFRRVQESQEQLDAARVNELQAKVNLRNALANLASLEASSLTRYKVRVE